MEGTEGVAEHAFNALTLLVWSVCGAVIGMIIAFVILFTVRLSGRKSPLMGYVFRRTRVSLPTLLAVLGVWVGYGLALPTDSGTWYTDIEHLLLLVLIAVLGWYGVTMAGLVQDAATVRLSKDPRDAQRIQTQSQVVRRVIQVVVVFVAIIAAVLTFPAARAPLMSLLASASVISVVVGLAAQSSLGNAFAGLQLAFTDAIRVGDTVRVTIGGKEESGVIEELTLTYVVMRLWDERRILLPSTEFTTRPFENWSRRDSEQLGVVLLELDWSVPMAQLRRQVEKIITGSDLWDKKTWNVQMVASAPGVSNPTVRIVASADNPGDLHDLKCEIREAIVAWIVQEVPWALPRARSQMLEVHQVNQDVSDGKVAELAQELAGITGKNTGKRGSPTPDPIHAARLLAAQQHAQDPKEVSDSDETMILPGGVRLFSGSAAAMERRSIYDGPGEETIRRREETAQIQALDAQGKLKETHDE